MKPRNLFWIAAVAVVLMGCATTTSTTSSAGMSGMSTDSRTALKDAMRELWADHVVWTRQYIIAAVADSPDAQAAADRLLKNQEDIGRAIVPYYGDAAGRQLTALLRDHILIAVDLVAAAKADDQSKLQDADRRWKANAADIATFLSGANPNWKRAEVLAMLNDHLRLTTNEAVARLQRNWRNDIATFDQIFDQAMMMADALTNGIIAQFPNKFGP